MIEIDSGVCTGLDSYSFFKDGEFSCNDFLSVVRWGFVRCLEEGSVREVFGFDKMSQ